MITMEDCELLNKNKEDILNFREDLKRKRAIKSGCANEKEVNAILDSLIKILDDHFKEHDLKEAQAMENDQDDGLDDSTMEYIEEYKNDFKQGWIDEMLDQYEKVNNREPYGEGYWDGRQSYIEHRQNSPVTKCTTVPNSNCNTTTPNNFKWILYFSIFTFIVILMISITTR